MKYIYAGYSKCGTKTMAEVFRRLGFRVCDFEETLLDCHGLNAFFNPDTTPREKREILQEQLGSFDVCMDFPHFYIWRDIMDAFPGAKVIFWERDIESWFKSLLNQFKTNHEQFNRGMPEWFLDLVNGILFPEIWNRMTEMRPVFSGLMFSSKYSPQTTWRGEFKMIDETMAKRNYRQHCADVLRNCPKDKLLVLDGPNCGWEVICNFVGVPVPTGVAWPHKNKNGNIIEEFLDHESRFPKMVQAEIKGRAIKAGVFGILAGCVGYYFYRNEDALDRLWNSIKLSLTK